METLEILKLLVFTVLTCTITYFSFKLKTIHKKDFK